MATALTITISLTKGTVKLDKQLILGNSYTVTTVGDTGIVYTITDCQGNALVQCTVATLAMNTQALVDEFENCADCGAAKVFHIYATKASLVVAMGQVVVKWTPITFTVDGTVATLKGDTGEQGARGKSAFEVWQENGNEGKSYGEFLLAITGATGPQGADGNDADVSVVEGQITALTTPTALALPVSSDAIGAFMEKVEAVVAELRSRGLV